MPRSEPDREDQRGRERRREFFEREVTRLMDRLYGNALRLSRDPDDAEDIVAETVSRAWGKLADLREPDAFEGWLFHILNNTFISVWRRRRTREKREESADSPETRATPEGDFSLFEKLHQPFLLWWGTAEEQFINDMLREDLQRALDALPDAFRIAIVLVEAQGYTYREVAELLDVPVGTVRSRLSRGRAMMQKMLWEQAREAGLADDYPGGRR